MHSLDGQKLKEILLSGVNNLYNHYPEVDALNVFPVPDGDTGMNMNLTLSSGAKEIENRVDNDVYTIISSFSKGLLYGARGNSGVIVSQIFRGISKSFKEKESVKSDDLITAFNCGAESAYKAVMRPVEGTILTVARESAEALKKEAESVNSIDDVLDLLVKEAKASLKRTPDLLPVLKEVGVVDSGGAGLVYIYEGMLFASKGNFIEKRTATSLDKNQKTNVEVAEGGYSLSFVLRIMHTAKKKELDQERFNKIVQSHANIIELTIDDEFIKGKVDTLTPGAIISYLQSFGEFDSISVDIIGKDNKEEPVVEEKVAPKEEYGIVAISSGEGITNLFTELGVSQQVSGGQTMNPSTEDIVAAIRKCNAKKVLVLPNNSNIIMAASQACDVLSDEVEAMVVPSKTIPQGIVATQAFNPDATLSENFESMKSSCKTVKTGSITYSIKDTIIDGIKVTKDHFMGIKDKIITCCHKHRINTFIELLESMITDESFLITILIGEDVENEEKEKVQEYIGEKYPDIDVEFIDGKQPVYSYLIGVE